MFYDVRLLSVVNGRFGVVWFLGCHNRRSLTRKQIESVKVRQTCKEIQELLPISNHHASLHTLMTLQLGVVICLELQIDFLIRDVDVSIRRAKDMSVIDLPNISDISQVLKNIDRVDEAQKKAPKRPFTCPAKTITLPNEDDINFTALEIFDPGFGQTEAIAGGNDALSLLSGDIFSDLPDNLRTMENIEDIFPETPGAPGRRKHENDPARDNVTRVEVEESEELPPKKRCPVLPNFEEDEEMQEPENLMDLVAPESVDSGHPTCNIPPPEDEPMEMEPNLVNMEPVVDYDVSEQPDLDEPLPIERGNSSPPLVLQEDADEQIMNVAPVARDDPPARRKPRKRVKIDKVNRIPRDQMQRNLETVEIDRANLFVRSNPEALSGVNFLRTAGRSFFVDRFKNGFITGIDDIQPAFDENLGGQDEEEAIRDINRGENQGDVADFIDNTHHFDPQSPGRDSRARSETNGDMNFDGEPQLMHEDISMQYPHQDISVDQSGPPVLEPTMLSSEILPTVQSPLREESEESLATVPLSQSFVTERIMNALDDFNDEVCFQDVISDSCFSRRQASSFFMGLLTLVAQGKIEAHQECFYEDIKISRR